MSRNDPRPAGMATETTAIISGVGAVGVGAPPPTQLGRYRLCHELAVGGMAAVYLARAEGAAGFEKFVAIKVIHGHLARERQFVEMFLDEARLASRIGHPNVCTVFDFGLADGVYYLAMEYLLGEPLLRLLEVLHARKNPADLRRLPFYAARIIADACEGLHAAHELKGPDGAPLGVVHRDVSPQNLFVTYDGSVKVVDFGVAKAAERISQTDVGTVKGKVGYVSPEQVRGAPVDRRADIWSLGVCLWESVTISRLFRKETDVATVMAVVEAPIPSPRQLVPSLPVEFEAIVMRALARDPERRYQTARDLGRDLRKFIAQYGEVVEMAELADWTQSLLPGEREQKMRLLEAARVSLNTTAPATRAPTGEPATEVSGTRPVRPAARSAVDDTLPPLPKRRGPGLLLLGVLLAGGAGAYGWFGTQGRLPAHWPLASRLAEFAARAAPEEVVPAEEPPQTTVPAPPDEPEVATTTAPALPSLPPSPETALPATAEEMAQQADPDAERLRRRREEDAIAPAPATAAPATTMPADVGHLRIRASEGFATVFLGGEQLGTTPFSVELPAGRHTLRILPYGREPATMQPVSVLGGAELNVTLRISSQAEAPPPPPDEQPPPAPDVPTD